MIVIYHANCRDGFCAAWLLSKLYPDAQFLPWDYGLPPRFDLLQHQDVIFVDFSFDRESMLQIINQANSVLVFDHHKSADPALRNLPQFVFDENECGASLVWKHFEQELVAKFKPTDLGAFTRVHWLVDYIKDYDLWQWELQDSDAINEGIRLAHFDFAEWDKLLFHDCLVKGKVVIKYREKYLASIIGKAFLVDVPVNDYSGHVVPCVNATHFISHTGEALAKAFPGSAFGVTYFHRLTQDGAGEFVFSLRSANGFDVSEIARKYGGGGHPAAAGFRSNKLFTPVAWNCLEL